MYGTQKPPLSYILFNISINTSFKNLKDNDFFSFRRQMGLCAKNDQNLPSSLFLGINGLTDLAPQLASILENIYNILHTNIDIPHCISYINSSPNIAKGYLFFGLKHVKPFSK